MLQPVRTLAAAAERVAAGDLDVRLAPTGDDELAQLATTFNGMTANLGRSVEELRRLEARARRFASDVSHELRTPLAAMTAVTDVLSAETAGMSPDAARAARLVVTETEHLRLLVNDLIEMSRFDAGTAALDVDVLDIGTVVDACLAMRGWTDTVHTDVPEGMSAALDRRRFDIALANVVGNAVRYGAAPVDVTAASRQDGVRSWLDVTVTDCGPGLPPDALPHVFERFYKADAARTRSDGSGLGLAIALENVRLHGGTLEAANRPQGGAVFTMRLPMHAAPVPTGRRVARPRPADSDRLRGAAWRRAGPTPQCRRRMWSARAASRLADLAVEVRAIGRRQLQMPGEGVQQGDVRLRVVADLPVVLLDLHVVEQPAGLDVGRVVRQLTWSWPGHI